MELREGTMEKMVVDPSFWRGKKVFVTGHSGFKGGWLSLWLQSMGAKVFGYSLAPETSPNFFDAVHLSKEMSSQFGDIRDFAALEKSLLEAEPDILFHLAAQPLVRASYQDPIGTYSTNVMGTAHVLQIARRLKSLRSVVVITTDKVYENLEKVYAYKEEDRLGGYDPYSNSKACAELVAAAFRNSFFNVKDYDKHKMSIVCARAGNVIGGGDWSKDRLIPDVIRAVSAGSFLEIRNPKAVRPWQHVVEPVRGYLLLAQAGFLKGRDFSKAFNIGPDLDDCVSVERILELMQKSWEGQIDVRFSKDEQPHEAQLLMLDHHLMTQETGWQPQMKIEKAIQQTAAWYQAALNRPAILRDLTLQQIAEA